MKATIVKIATTDDLTKLLRLYGQDDFDDHLIETVTVELKINEPVKITVTRFVEADERFVGPDR